MASTDWLDFLAALWQLPYHGSTERLTTYKIIGRDEWPANIQPPCVLTWTENETGRISLGGGSETLYFGKSEFHLHKNMDKTKIPFIEKFKKEIIVTAAQNIGLNDPDNIEFYLAEYPNPRIIGPVGLDYGDQHQHFGLVVNWTVIEDISADVTVSLTPP